MLENQVQENQDDNIEVEVQADNGQEHQDAEKNASESGVIDHEDDDSDVEEVVVSIGDEPPPVEEEKPTPKWVKELRKSYRELQRKNRELEAKLTTQVEVKPTALGQKPTLDGCDYDSERYEAELESWYERKRQVDAEQVKARDAEEALNRHLKSKLDAYGKARAELRVRDYEDAEETVVQHLDINQQWVIIKGADNPALVVYAIGKNPAKAKELASIKDPIELSFAVAKLEKDLKVSNRLKKAPEPEKVVTGNGRISGAIDSELERLRAKAEKTGDLTEIMRYKRKLKQKSG